MSDLSRRNFLRGAVGAAAALGACHKPELPSPTQASELPSPTQASEPVAAPGAPEAPDPRPPKSRVVLVRHEAALDKRGEPDPAILAAMLDDGVRALQDVPGADQAWAGLFGPADVVGIKTNVWRFLPTPAALEEALRARLLRLRIAPDHVAIDDRGVLRNDLFAKATALINVRTLRTHHWSGIGSCLKNYIMFHPEPSSWHADACADLAGLWQLPMVRGKTRLNIQVALTPLFHGKGPHHFQAEYTWPYCGLILGADPVAVDAIAVRLLTAKRREHFGREEPFAVEPKHVGLADLRHRLGWARPERIELVKIGWDKGLLI